MRRERIIAAPALIALLGLATTLPAQDSLRAPVRSRSVAEDLQLFSQVLNQIRINHPDSLDSHALFMAAVEGMVAAADPHSYVIPAARLDAAREAALRDGKLTSVPISFQFVDGAPLVVATAPGSHAVSADILPGDELIAVDGRPVAAASSDELDLALSGSKGSTVRLSLRRRRADGSIAQHDRNVKRERAEESSAVPAAFMLDSATGYVRVTTFMGDKIADDLHAALERLEHDGMHRLVLDRRGNGGGRVDEAKRIASEFLPKGTIVFTASGRKPEVTDTGRVQRSFWKSERRYPIVLLVDAGTASASEIVAGALQDHDRALIVGRTTFGKSLLMQTFPLTDGSRMSLVIGKVKTPCGRVIQRDYHATSRHEYYHEAGAAIDTVSRPSCSTDTGRKVYGGGGIVPDVMLRETPTPAWLVLASERGLLFTWAAGIAGKSGVVPATAAALSHWKPDAATIADFRSYATSNGVTIRSDADADRLLARALVRAIAYSKLGDAGFYRVAATNDPEVSAAVSAFADANKLLRTSGTP